MRLIRRWPKWRRRGIIARRNYRKVYWYCLEFKDEFVNEIIRPRADREENPLSQYPLYYRGYLFVRVRKCSEYGAQVYVSFLGYP